MEQIGSLMIRAADIDLDGFLKVVEEVGSPQALAMGINPKAVTGATGWTDLARLLRPFWERAREQVEQAQKKRGQR